MTTATAGEPTGFPPCMPDYAWWKPDHPGSPCLIEPGHVADAGYIVEVRGEWMPAMCLTCGATDNPPWWMNSMCFQKELPKGVG